MSILLTESQLQKILIYETGFDQLHPNFEIIRWMKEQGYKYKTDWHCNLASSEYKMHYALNFPNDEIQTMFILRWL